MIILLWWYLSFALCWVSSLLIDGTLGFTQGPSNQYSILLTEQHAQAFQSPQELPLGHV